MYKVKAISVWYNNSLKLKSKAVDDETNNLDNYRKKQINKYRGKYQKDISVDLIYLSS